MDPYHWFNYRYLIALCTTSYLHVFLCTNCFRIFPESVTYPDEPGFTDENIEDASSSASVQTVQTNVLLEMHDLPGQHPLFTIVATENSENDGGNQKQPEASEKNLNQNDAALASENTLRGVQTKFGGPPGFLEMLVMDFNNCVVSHLDSFSKAAVQEQIVLVDPAKFAKVKSAVVDRVLDLLLEHGDGKTVPGVKFFDSVVDVLSIKYPPVFGSDPSVLVNGERVRLFHSRGTGGLNGIKGRFSK
jgi:hypothetical protein